MNNNNVGKKDHGNRKKRMTKRERAERDSKVKYVRPLFIAALGSRIASRAVAQVLSSENIKRVQDMLTAEMQSMLENEARSAIVTKSSEVIETEEHAEEEDPISVEKEKPKQNENSEQKTICVTVSEEQT